MSDIRQVVGQLYERKNLEELAGRANFTGPIQLPQHDFTRDLLIYLREPALSHQFNPRYGINQGPPKKLMVSGAAVVYNPKKGIKDLALYVINEGYYSEALDRYAVPTPEEQEEALLSTLTDKIKVRSQPNEKGTDVIRTLEYFASEDQRRLIKQVQRKLKRGSLLQAIKKKLEKR